MSKNKYRTIIHVDMDAFFASIEQLDNKDYLGKPVVVGADPKGGHGRGVVSAASYEARKFGIHSALPISKAYSKCPDAIFLPPRMYRYIEVSKEVMDEAGIIPEEDISDQQDYPEGEKESTGQEVTPIDKEVLEDEEERLSIFEDFLENIDEEKNKGKGKGKGKGKSKDKGDKEDDDKSS